MRQPYRSALFASLLLIHKDKVAASVVLVITFGAAMTGMLYAWLTSPLEPEHGH